MTEIMAFARKTAILATDNVPAIPMICIRSFSASSTFEGQCTYDCTVLFARGKLLERRIYCHHEEEGGCAGGIRQ
jgi:hypothetical protein